MQSAGADLEGACGACAPSPLKFAKHILYNVKKKKANNIPQKTKD
jgi:hypothetical protein